MEPALPQKAVVAGKVVALKGRKAPLCDAVTDARTSSLSRRPPSKLKMLAMDALGLAGTILSNGLAFASLPAILKARAARDIGATNTLVFPFLCCN